MARTGPKHIRYRDFCSYRIRYRTSYIRYRVFGIRYRIRYIKYRMRYRIYNIVCDMNIRYCNCYLNSHASFDISYTISYTISYAISVHHIRFIFAYVIARPCSSTICCTKRCRGQSTLEQRRRARFSGPAVLTA